MIEAVIFWFLALLTVIPAILVVTVRNVFHAALWLILALTGVAGLYAMMAADFLFAVQLLVYVGGIMVVLLFVVLLSGKPSDWVGRQLSEKRWLATSFAGFLMVALGSVIAGWPVTSSPAAQPAVTTRALGHLLMGGMVLPFEFISLVLLVALVGAVYFSVKKPS